MTLGEGKNKAYMLLDEHTSGGEVDHDEDMEAKMAGFFDTAQKQIAMIKPIIRLKTVARRDGTTLYALPSDCMRVRTVYRDGTPYRCQYRGGRLYIPADDDAEEIQIEYLAIPETIGDDTPDDTEFEVAEDAAQAMPFFVAAQLLMAETTDYAPLMQLYNLMVSNLKTDAAGGGTFRQTFFRGG